jgi:hypothetical protein
VSDVETLTGFTTVLRERIEAAQRSLEVARRGGHAFEVHLHSARLLDLLDRAERNAVDTTGWVDGAVLDTAIANCK